MTQSPPKQPPFLFYSPRCVHSQQLIELIKQNPDLAKKIQPVNVDEVQRHKLPKQLVGVPTLLVNGQFITDSDTYKWVQFQHLQNQRWPFVLIAFLFRFHLRHCPSTTNVSMVCLLI